MANPEIVKGEGSNLKMRHESAGDAPKRPRKGGGGSRVTAPGKFCFLDP